LGSLLAFSSKVFHGCFALCGDGAGLAMEVGARFGLNNFKAIYGKNLWYPITITL